MNFPLLQDIVILLGFSVLVVLILQKFRLPSVLGFLLTGIIIGPHGFSLIEAAHEVELLAEIGVILLLFVIGMEISIQQLKSMKKTVFLGGFLQVGLSILVTSLVYVFFNAEWNDAVFIGFLVSLSSTAIVLKILQDRNEITAPHGRNALGILIFQDIIVVPMMLVTPMLAGESTNIGIAILTLVIKFALVIGFTYVLAKYIVPRLMLMIARTKSKELFLLTTITICFAVAYLTSQVGLSLAFGAFLAGLVISESDYSHQATSTILPFRELFTSFFFISIGMLLDLEFFLNHTFLILLLVGVVFFVKGAIVSLSVLLLRHRIKSVILTGLALFQIGEFAFILSRVGINYGLLTEEMNQYFLSVSILTMLITPFILMYSNRIASLFIRSKNSEEATLHIDDDGHLENHLVIVGFGINGRNLAKAAKYANIPYVILELNADTVQEEKANNEPIYYGDAIHDYILESVKVQRARVVVIAISDSAATRVVIRHVRHLSNSVNIVVRTRYVNEIEELLSLGADEVIPEEFETSIEIFSRVLQNYLFPIHELEKLVENVRSDNYDIFQTKSKSPVTIASTKIPNFNITSVRLIAESGKIVGKTIQEADVRKNYGVNVLAISRGDDFISSVLPNEKFRQDDLVFISGDQEHIEMFFQAVS